MKRFIALMLSFLMCFGTFGVPASAFQDAAAAEDEAAADASSERIDLDGLENYALGKSYSFSWKGLTGDDISWRGNLKDDGLKLTNGEIATSSFNEDANLYVGVVGTYGLAEIVIDLGESRDVNRVVIRDLADNGGSIRDLDSDSLAVSFSADGNEFISAESLSDTLCFSYSVSEDGTVTQFTNLYTHCVDFAAAGARFVRISFQSTKYIMAFSEIEIYGEAGQGTTEDASAELPVADTTYTATFYDNGDGTGTIKVTLPDSDHNTNGKVVLAVSDNLEYIEGTLVNGISGGLANPNYDRDGYTGLLCNFMSINPVAGSTVLLTADFNIAEGATITTDDFDVVYWQLGERLGTDYDSGDVKKEVFLYESEDSTVEPPVDTSDDISEPSEDVSEPEETSEPVESSDYPVVPNGNNLLSDATYVYTSMNAFMGDRSDYNATLLNDGVVKTAEDFQGENWVKAGVAVELAGSYQENVITFTLEEAADLSTVVFRGIRKVNELFSVNRHCNVAKIEISYDGLNFVEVDFATSEVALDGEGTYSEYNGGELYNQFYDITATLLDVAENILAVQVTLNTLRFDGSNAYIVHLDEVEAYGPEAVEDSSEDESVDLPVADTTYTATFYDNGDGTGTIKITLPDSDHNTNGKVVLAVSDNLEYIEGTLVNGISGGLANPNYDRDGYTGLLCNFMSIKPVAGSTVLLTADFNIAEGATITTDDFNVVYWQLGERLGTYYDSGDVKKEVFLYESEDSTVEPPVDTSDDISEPDEPSEDTSEDESSDDVTEDSSDDVSSEAPDMPEISGDNVALGVEYTISSNDKVVYYQGMCSDIDASFPLYHYILSDGIVREGVDEYDDGAFNGSNGVPGITVELAGTNRDYYYTFDIEDCSVSTVVIRNGRRFGNRYANIAAVEVLKDGVWTALDFAEYAIPVANAPLYYPDSWHPDIDGPVPQFFDLVASFDVVEAEQVRITVNTDFEGDNVDINTLIPTTGTNRCYVAQFDEIEIYGTGSEDVPSMPDDSSEDETSDDVTEDTSDVPAVDFATYTATFYDNGDGTGTIKITLPDSDQNTGGKVVLAVSENLVYIEGTLANGIPFGLINPDYDMDGYAGLAANFADDDGVAGGSVILTADFIIANGATVTIDDFDVVYWNLGEYLGTKYNSGDVIKEIYEPIKYTVRFVSEGTVISEQWVIEGQAAIEPIYPVKEGYTFTGWDKAFDNVTADLTVNAIWTINTYTVTFNNWDGTVLDAQTVDYGTAATAPADPEREGYTFTGWDKAFNNVTSDLAVNAIWTINTYTVTFNNWDGTVLDAQTVDYGTAATAPADPEREGYTFTGWDKAFNNVTSDLTVNAVFERIYYNVSFVVNGAVVATQRVAYGESAAAPADPVVEGYNFTGWDVAFDNVTSDLTVTANLEKKGVVGDVNGDGRVDSADAALVLQYDLGLIDALAEEFGDVNGDGYVDSADASRILQYDVGLIESF